MKVTQFLLVHKVVKLVSLPLCHHTIIAAGEDQNRKLSCCIIHEDNCYDSQLHSVLGKEGVMDLGERDCLLIFFSGIVRGWVWVSRCVRGEGGGFPQGALGRWVGSPGDGFPGMYVGRGIEFPMACVHAVCQVANILRP